MMDSEEILCADRYCGEEEVIQFWWRFKQIRLRSNFNDNANLLTRNQSTYTSLPQVHKLILV